MTNRPFNVLLKVAIIVIAYVIATRFFPEDYILLVVIILTALYVAGFILFRKAKPLDELNRFGSSKNYFIKTEKVMKNDEMSYHVYMAYGLLYKGDIKESDKHLKKLDIDALQEEEELYHLYLQTAIRVEFYEENIKYLDEAFKMLLSNDAIHPNTIRITKTMILLLEKRFDEALEELLKIIPKEDRRHVTMELELYLADVYIALDQIEDAKAVLTFVSSKKFDTVHVEQAKKKLEELS